MKLAIKSSKTYTRGPTLNPFENTVKNKGSIFNLQCKRFSFSGKTQECNYFRNNFIYINAIKIRSFISMGGVLGNETLIDRLLVSSALSPTNSILIEHYGLFANVVSKRWFR